MHRKQKTMTRMTSINTDVPMVSRWISIICHPVDLSTVISAGLVTFNESLLQELPIHLMLLVFCHNCYCFIHLLVCSSGGSQCDRWMVDKSSRCAQCQLVGVGVFGEACWLIQYGCDIYWRFKYEVRTGEGLSMSSVLWQERRTGVETQLPVSLLCDV